jgi:hypothetical protein
MESPEFLLVALATKALTAVALSATLRQPRKGKASTREQGMK